MLLVYTGPGKGKTSAAVGQVVRALGHGLNVAFGQFIKAPGQAGEQKMLSDILGDRFLAGGVGFYRRAEEYPEHRKAVEETLSWARRQIEDGVDVLVLDEALCALQAGLLKDEELKEVIDATEAGKRHLVLTGRGLPDWLMERADTVSTLTETKHPFSKRGKAARGVDF